MACLRLDQTEAFVVLDLAHQDRRGIRRDRHAQPHGWGPRQNEYKIEVSPDKSVWTEVASGALTHDSQTTQVVPVSRTATGRYVKFTAETKHVNGIGLRYLGVYVLGGQRQRPNRRRGGIGTGMSSQTDRWYRRHCTIGATPPTNAISEAFASTAFAKKTRTSDNCALMLQGGGAAQRPGARAGSVPAVVQCGTQPPWSAAAVYRSCAGALVGTGLSEGHFVINPDAVPRMSCALRGPVCVGGGLRRLCAVGRKRRVPYRKDHDAWLHDDTALPPAALCDAPRTESTGWPSTPPPEPRQERLCLNGRSIHDDAVPVICKRDADGTLDAGATRSSNSLAQTPLKVARPQGTTLCTAYTMSAKNMARLGPRTTSCPRRAASRRASEWTAMSLLVAADQDVVNDHLSNTCVHVDRLDVRMARLPRLPSADVERELHAAPTRQALFSQYCQHKDRGATWTPM